MLADISRGRPEYVLAKGKQKTRLQVLICWIKGQVGGCSTHQLCSGCADGMLILLHVRAGELGRLGLVEESCAVTFFTDESEQVMSSQVNPKASVGMKKA